MKAILVIDMPIDCYDCPCYYEDKDRCEVLIKKAGADDEKPSWCPLKAMPEKINEKAIDFVPRGYWSPDDYEAKGWNDCIEEIEK